MKKLKLFLLMFAAAIASAGFTACSDDDDEAAASIVGSWIRQDTYGIDIITFTAEGTWIEQYQDLEEPEYSDTDSGTYSYDGSVLILVYDDGDSDAIPVVVSGDTLVLDGEVYYTRMYRNTTPHYTTPRPLGGGVFAYGNETTSPAGTGARGCRWSPRSAWRSWASAS